MSNNRPYRATYVGATRTVHYDYETKEARKLLEGPRDQAGQGGIPVTVTSRKPLKPGTPVCWVNVYAANSEPEHLHAHASKSAADAMASPGRLHCIPVYLPGEGAERRSGSGPLVPLEEHNREVNTARAEVERLANLAKDWETTARVRAEERDAAQASEANHRALADQGIKELSEKWVSCIQEKKLLQREVEQWKDAAEHADGKLSEERMSSQAERKECDRLRAEVERLTKELAAAQAQAMPAGKVVYGASGRFGINRDFQTIEFADKRLRDTYRKADGWTWFTRVEES